MRLADAGLRVSLVLIDRTMSRRKCANLYMHGDLYFLNLFVQHYGYVHLCAGDLLREEKARQDSPFRPTIEDHFRRCAIVPVEITCALLENVSSRAHA